MKFQIRLLFSYLLLVNVVSKVHCQGFFNQEHAFDLFRSVVSGVGSQLMNVLPKPQDFWRTSMETFVGLPETAVIGTIHQLCSLYIASDEIQPKISPEIEQMSFQLRTPCHAESFPIKEADKIVKSPHFDINKKVVLFVSGWTSNIESNNILAIAKAYNCRGDYNYLALNASYFIDTLYTWSAFNTDEISRIVAVGLQKLHRHIPLENFHLVGFSLGAHIVGSAGRYFKQFTGARLPRITGLDPANPCFSEGETLSGLQRGDADFIDVIHTNPGGLGKRDQLGDADFYPGGYVSVKPGCISLGCSHQRAWEFYAESVYPGHEKDFLATRCNSLKKVDDGICNGEPIPMGFNTPTDSKGSFFLAVNRIAPFGQNAYLDDDILASTCGLCESYN